MKSICQGYEAKNECRRLAMHLEKETGGQEGTSNSHGCVCRDKGTSVVTGLNWCTVWRNDADAGDCSGTGKIIVQNCGRRSGIGAAAGRRLCAFFTVPRNVERFRDAFSIAMVQDNLIFGTVFDLGGSSCDVGARETVDTGHNIDVGSIALVAGKRKTDSRVVTRYPSYLIKQ